MYKGVSTTRTHTHTHTHTVDYISNLVIYIQVLQLLRKAPLTVRYTICQQVLSMLYNTPHHVNDIALSPGWESLFLWQLTPCEEAHPTAAANSTSEANDVEQKQSSEKNGEPRRRKSKMSPNNGSKLPSVLEPTVESESQSNTENGAENGGAIPGLSGLSVAAANEPRNNERYRSRSAAFVDPTTKEDRPIFISEKIGVVDTANVRRKNKERKRGSVTYSRCWDDTVETESDEMSRTCNIVTETIAYILWRSTDNHTDRPPWKVR